MATRVTPPATEVEIEYGGQTHKGSYTVQGKMVTVTTGFGQKSTQVGGSPAKIVARMLLREIVEAEEKGGQS